MILKEPSSAEAVGEEGMYTRSGMCFNGAAGLRRILLILLKALKSSAYLVSLIWAQK